MAGDVEEGDRVTVWTREAAGARESDRGDDPLSAPWTPGTAPAATFPP